jgi:uncharacterized RDD family membrane protein YckC
MVDRGTDGPMPYGPSSGGANPGAPGAPDGGTGAPGGRPASDIPPAPGLPPPPGPPPSFLPPVAPWAPPPGAFSTSAPGPAGLAYGRTLDRLMAWWLDSIIVAIPALILAALLGGGAATAGLRLAGVSLVASVIAVGIHLLYFVAFWTGSSRATPAMRLMKLQISDAKTGDVPTVQQGIVRWLAIGGVFQLVQIIPGLTAAGAALAVLWALVLLATTATSPTRQGVHDRLADTALVQPAGAQTPAVTCLILLVALLVVWVLGIVALIAIGGQVSSILSTVGAST